MIQKYARDARIAINDAKLAEELHELYAGKFVRLTLSFALHSEDTTGIIAGVDWDIERGICLRWYDVDFDAIQTFDLDDCTIKVLEL